MRSSLLVLFAIGTMNQHKLLLKEYLMSDQKEQTFYDEGAFYLKKTPYGLWHSFDKDEKPIITSLTEEQCVNATRCYLKWLQEGFPETKKHEGTVGGKL
jgi:hypothetical protein